VINYDPHNWLDHLFDIEGSMVSEIVGRVAACVLWAVAVAVFDRYVYPVGISAAGHTLVGFAVGLLLVFRTNASYDRFWEGRRQWGSLTNDTRNFGRAARVLLQDDPALLDEALRWTSAFPYAVMLRLRGKSAGLPATLGLPAGEVAEVEASGHVALAVADRITRVVGRARARGLISDYLFGTLDVIVQRFLDCLGACERIHSTPLPYVYVVHLRRALIFYCFTLPFALVGTFGWGEIPTTLLVAYLFFGIEEIGVEIEDPFGDDSNDLPLDLYCQRIEAQLLGQGDEVTGRALPVDDLTHAG
jgi:putative membrane protein